MADAPGFFVRTTLSVRLHVSGKIRFLLAEG